MRSASFISLLAITLLFPACANATILYDVIDLGTLSAYERGIATSINDMGQIIGAAWSHPDLPWESYSRATLFDPTGNGDNVNLGTLGDGGSWACSINDSGQIVGWVQDSSAKRYAVSFDPTGAGDNISMWLGAALSINNGGQIVGYNPYSGAVLFDPSSGWPSIFLGTLGGEFSIASEINNTGQIVGYAEDAQGNERATVFDPTGGRNNLELGTIDDVAFPNSYAVSINDSGQIVGYCEALWQPAVQPRRATLFDPTGTGNNIDLGVLLGHESSEAWEINNRGQIVGHSVTPTGGYLHATLFDPSGNGNNIDLNTLIDPDSGWTLEYACSINNHGWIVGSGINPDGYERAYLLKPVPEPATIALLGLGALLLTRRRK